MALYRIDGIKWEVTKNEVTPICPDHGMRLQAITLIRGRYGDAVRIASYEAQILQCTTDDKQFNLPRQLDEQRTHVRNTVDAQAYREIDVINLDDEAIPVAKATSRDKDYWVEAKVTESKSGTRLMILAGSKKEKNKTQLFIEPETGRLSFDQNDAHPREVFARVEATFKDSRTSIERNGIEVQSTEVEIDLPAEQQTDRASN